MKQNGEIAMTDIDKTGGDLIAKLEVEVDRDKLNIAHHARERGLRMGYPNVIDNILVPLWSIISQEPLQNLKDD
jgi:hypothetical protein